MCHPAKISVHTLGNKYVDDNDTVILLRYGDVSTIHNHCSLMCSEVGLYYVLSVIQLYCYTVYALIFAWFNIYGIRGLEAIRESLDPRKFKSGSCVMAKHGRPQILKCENR